MRQSSEDLANFYQDPKGPFLETSRGAENEGKRRPLKKIVALEKQQKEKGSFQKSPLGYMLSNLPSITPCCKTQKYLADCKMRKLFHTIDLI